jgi:hypothetical protein
MDRLDRVAFRAFAAAATIAFLGSAASFGWFTYQHVSVRPHLQFFQSEAIRYARICEDRQKGLGTQYVLGDPCEERDKLLQWLADGGDNQRRAMERADMSAASAVLAPVALTVLYYLLRWILTGSVRPLVPPRLPERSDKNP